MLSCFLPVKTYRREKVDQNFAYFLGPVDIYFESEPI